MPPCIAPVDGDDWLGLTDAALPIGELYEWCVRPDCGAVVLFSGTVRDHAEGRDGRRELEYEAYDEMVVPKLQRSPPRSGSAGRRSGGSSWCIAWAAWSSARARWSLSCRRRTGRRRSPPPGSRSTP